MKHSAKTKDGEILPCPYCKTDDSMLAVNRIHEWHYVSCNSCKALGPDMETEHEAISKWNEVAAHFTEAAKECGKDARVSTFAHVLLTPFHTGFQVAIVPAGGSSLNIGANITVFTKNARVASYLTEGIVKLCNDLNTTESALFLMNSSDTTKSD